MEMEKRDFLAQELARIMAQLRRLKMQHDSFAEIKQSEFFLLRALKFYSSSESMGIKVSDLSTYLQITPAAVTHVINSLEGDGYIERLPDPSDRRVVLIKLTAKGEYLIESMKMEYLETLKGLVDYLGERDSKELVRLLTSAMTYMKERREQNGEKSRA